MKWGIILLVILGVVAAACAAVLVNTLRVGSAGDADKNSAEGVEVMRAKMRLPAMTVLTLDHVVKETVPKNDAEEGHLSSPIQVIGKVLAVPVVEGQVLTKSCFVTEGTGAQLAAALPHGMRAVTLSLSRGAVPDMQLLYPGCVVDVLVSFRLGRGMQGEAVSTTLLHGIQVLAIQGESVVSAKEGETEDAPKARRSGSGGLKVTVLVDPRQAEALQLAASFGSVSLAMRNPLDRRLVDTEATVLSEGRLAQLGSLLRPATVATSQVERESLAEEPSGTGDLSAFDPNILIQPPLSDYGQTVRPSPKWDITVIRGRETQVRALDIPESGTGAGADAKK